MSRKKKVYIMIGIAIIAVLLWNEHQERIDTVQNNPYSVAERFSLAYFANNFEDAAKLSIDDLKEYLESRKTYDEYVHSFKNEEGFSYKPTIFELSRRDNYVVVNIGWKDAIKFFNYEYYFVYDNAYMTLILKSFIGKGSEPDKWKVTEMSTRGYEETYNKLHNLSNEDLDKIQEEKK